MFLLTIHVPDGCMKWGVWHSFLDAYGKFLASKQFSTFQFGIKLQDKVVSNEFSVEYFPRDDEYAMVVNIGFNGIESEAILKPHAQKGVLELKERTKANISGQEIEVTDGQYESLALGHIKMVLVVLEQTQSAKFLKMLDGIRDRSEN